MSLERHYHPATPSSKDKHPIPPRVNLREAFIHSAIRSVYHLGEIYGMDQSVGLRPIMEGLGSNSVVVFASTKLYDQHMEAAGQNASHPPFGVELNTLSPNVQLVLYPRRMFEPTKEDREFAKEEGIEVKDSDRQAMLYVLDGFRAEASNEVNQAANLLFVSHMINAMVEGGYPIERDNQSQEFVDQVAGGMEAVRKYARDLTPEQQAQLFPFSRRMVDVPEDQLGEFARAYAAYQVEPMKSPGLREPGYFFMKPDDPNSTPVASVAATREYLHVSDRNLPLRPSSEKGVPALPWREYGRNRWNRDHQLFGRYETNLDAGRVLRVDFRLDSTHMPAKYGFFDTIEIASVANGAIIDHVVLGQEVNFAHLQQARGIVFPIVVAGEFDFQHYEVKTKLELLVGDNETKPDVARVLADLIRVYDEYTLI